MKDTLKPASDTSIDSFCRIEDGSGAVPEAVSSWDAEVLYRLPGWIPEWACIKAINPHLDWRRQSVGRTSMSARSGDAAGSRSRRRRIDRVEAESSSSPSAPMMEWT